jgi:hypothetical protein
LKSFRPIIAILAIALSSWGVACAKPVLMHPTVVDVTAPTYQSATIAANGTAVTVTFSEPVVAADAAGFTLTPSGAAATLTLDSGSYSSSLVFTASRQIESSETATIAYSSTTGDVEDTSGNALATFTAQSVTNNSTYNSSDPYAPIEPEAFSTAYSLPTGGTTYTIDDADDLQATIDAADPGDVIVMQAGDTWTGNFTLPNKGSNMTPIYIISSALASLPAEGTRVALADAADMPKIQSTNNQGALYTKYGANNYRLVGIEFDKPSTNGVLIIGTGYDGTHSSFDIATQVSELPYRITFDRCIVRSSNDALSIRRGILLCGKYMAVVDSYIDNIKDSTEAQAIHITFGEGPYKIDNNYLEGAGENFMAGGDGVPITNDIPSDITFTNNYCFKPTAWNGSWEVKNLFELKRAQRVKVEGNVFENNWVDGQNGTAVLFTPRNQNDDAPWTVVKDVMFRNNVIRNSAKVFLIGGEDDVSDSAQSTRITIDNNLCDEITTELVTVSTPDLPLLYLTLTNNTMLHDTSVVGNKAHDFDRTGGGAAVNHLIAQNNIFTHGDYNTTYAADTDDETWSDNGWILNPASSRQAVNISNFATWYPNDIKEDDIDDVDFTDYATGDYELLNTSSFYEAGSDSENIGVNWTELEAAISGVVQ